MANNYWGFLKGIFLKPVSSSGVSAKGEIEVLDSSGKMVLHNGSSASAVVTEAHAADITNKTLLQVDNLQLDGNILSATSGNVQLGSSSVQVDSSGNMDITGSLDVDNINFNGNTISSTGAITLDPDSNNQITLQGTSSSTIKVEAGNINVGLEADAASDMNFRRNAATLGKISTSSGFFSINGGTGSGHIVIQSDGDVGINESSPTAKLHVNGTMKVLQGAGNGIDVIAAGAFPLAASMGANTMTLGGASSTVSIPGNLTVDGTTTFNSTTLNVADKNITVNNGGNDAASEGAGLTVDRTGTEGSFIYKDASATKFALGALGSEVDVVGISSSQTLTNKTISGASNTLSNIADGSLSESYLKADGSRALTANWSAGAFTITANSVQLGSAANRISGLSTIVNTGTLTLPTSTDTLVGRATTDTLTNKTVAVGSNSITSTASRAAQFGAGGSLEASSVTSTELNLLSGVTGQVVGTTNAQDLSNKRFLDSNKLADTTDPTKQVAWDVSGATTSTATTLDFNQSANRTITFPNASTTLVGTDTADALSNKTSITVDNINLNGNTISSVGDLTLDPDSNNAINLQGTSSSTFKIETGTLNLGLEADAGADVNFRRNAATLGRLSTSSGFFSVNGDSNLGQIIPHTNGRVSMNNSGGLAPTGMFQVYDSANTNVMLAQFSGATGSVAHFISRSSRGTPAAPTATQSGDRVMGILAAGHGTTANNFMNTAEIRMAATEAYTDSASGSQIEFYTTTTGATGRVLRATIGNSGNLDVTGTISSGGSNVLKANGTQALTANWNAGAFSITANSVVVGSAANTISALSTIINTGTLTLPTSTDTLVGRATTDNLTNKNLLPSSKLTDSSDTSKAVAWDVAGATTATTTTLDFNQSANRTITFPNASTTLMGNDTTDTVSGKTFAQNIIADANNTRDLGSTGTRFKDLYLAGNANVTGTGNFTGLITGTAGVKVKDAGAGSTTLSHYEEATFSPVLTAATGGALSATTTANFTRIGRTVFFEIAFINIQVVAQSGAMTITGMPYTGQANTGNCLVNPNRLSQSAGTSGGPFAFFASTGTTLTILSFQPGDNNAKAMVVADLANATAADLVMSGFYNV